MKHLSVHLLGDQWHDEKGHFCKIIDDRGGNALTISDQDAAYWADVFARMGSETQEIAVTSPLPGHAIKFRVSIYKVIASRNGLLTLKNTSTSGKCWMTEEDLLQMEVEPSDVFVDDRLIPTWIADDLDIAGCECGKIVPVSQYAKCDTRPMCWDCLGEDL